MSFLIARGSEVKFCAAAEAATRSFCAAWRSVISARSG